MGMRFAENGLYYIITVFSLTYAVTALKLSRQALLPALTINYAIGLAMMPFYGWLSDKIGRRAVYMFGAIMCGVLSFPSSGCWTRLSEIFIGPGRPSS